jgi:hypothetical protein
MEEPVQTPPELVQEPTEPGVVTGYKLYCIVLLILVLIVGPLSVLEKTSHMTGGPIEPGQPLPTFGTGNVDEILQQMDKEFDRQRDEEVQVTWGLTILVCVILGGMLIAALVIRPTPEAWAYHVLIICLGLCGCLFPVSILLLVQWFQPATQRYFGRTPES